jgi:hypothetical protein
VSEQDYSTLEERVWRATGALSAYVAANPDYVWDKSEEAPYNVEDAFVDLMADLFHLAGKFGLDAERLCDRARMHYEFEVLEESE